MAPSKKGMHKDNQLKTNLQMEFNFINNIFSVLSVPARLNDESTDDVDDYVYVTSKNKSEKADNDASTKRAHSMVELQQRLEKIKKDNNYSIKKKLTKKSLTTKLNKKARLAERRLKLNPLKSTLTTPHVKKEPKDTPGSVEINKAKPVFNSQGKLVFSKFDFTNMGEKQANTVSMEKDPKKILENLKKQEETVKKLEESGNLEKAIEIKEKIAWKNVLAKSEGQKVKDDPILLKKSMKKMEQKKKQSKKEWDERIRNVEQKKQERQQKRKENIAKKSKEKKSKKMKSAIKKGRIVV